MAVLGGVFFIIFGVGVVMLIINLFKKRSKKTSAIITIAGLVGFIVSVAMTPTPDTKQAKSSNTKVSQSSKSYSLTDSVSDFTKLTDSYAKIPNKHGYRTTAWEKIENSKVTWTGTVIESSERRLYVIRSDKYTKGITWSGIGDNAYYVFVAKGSNYSTYTAGQSVTVSGTLVSRGDPNMHLNWDLEEATVK